MLRIIEYFAKSLKVSENCTILNRSHTTFQYSATLTAVLSCIVSSYLTLNNVVTLKYRLEVTEGHSK